MPAITITVNDKDIQELLGQLARRASDLTPFMREVGEIGVDSIKECFIKGQSPDGIPWKPSHRAMLTGGRTLVNTATLKNSIHAVPGPRQVVIGTPVQYANAHQFGMAKGTYLVRARIPAHTRKSRKGNMHQVRAHTRRQWVPWGDVPARPFMGFSREALQEVREAALDYLLGGDAHAR